MSLDSRELITFCDTGECCLLRTGLTWVPTFYPACLVTQCLCLLMRQHEAVLMPGCLIILPLDLLFKKYILEEGPKKVSF